MADESLLQVEGLNQYYGGSHILRNVALQARVGEITVVLGRNGVGKTTLLKSLMGVVPVKAGRVTLGGTEITKATSYERVRAGIGYVPQGREIFGRLTVEDNLRTVSYTHLDVYKRQLHASATQSPCAIPRRVAERCCEGRSALPSGRARPIM